MIAATSYWSEPQIEWLNAQADTLRLPRAEVLRRIVDREREREAEARKEVPK